MKKFIKGTIHLLLLGPLFLASCFITLCAIVVALTAVVGAMLLCLMTFVIGAFINLYYKEPKGEGKKAEAT